MQIVQTETELSVNQGLPKPVRPSLCLIPPAAPSVSVGSLRVSTERALASLRHPWQDLHRRVPGATLYQSHGWCEVWVEACAGLGRPVDVRIITVFEEGRLVLLWPLAVRSLGPVGILHALAEPATQYCDLLVERSPRSAEWVDLALRQVRAEPGVDLVHLHNVREGGGLDSFGRSHLGQHQLSQDEAPFLRLSGEAEGEELGRPKTRSGRSVNALKRHWRNLERHGRVEFQSVPRCRHVAAVAEALELKRAWLQERGGVSAGYDHPANGAAISEIARRGLFMVTRLSVGGETAAVEIGLIERGRYYSLIQSYDRRYAAHAPGRLLLWKLFAETGLGIEVFDFLAPTHPHKTEWTDAVIVVTDYAIPLNLKGRLAVSYLRTGKPWLKRAFGTLPMPVRKRVIGLAHRFY